MKFQLIHFHSNYRFSSLSLFTIKSSSLFIYSIHGILRPRRTPSVALISRFIYNKFPSIDYQRGLLMLHISMPLFSLCCIKHFFSICKDYQDGTRFLCKRVHLKKCRAETSSLQINSFKKRENNKCKTLTDWQVSLKYWFLIFDREFGMKLKHSVFKRHRVCNDSKKYKHSIKQIKWLTSKYIDACAHEQSWTSECQCFLLFEQISVGFHFLENKCK